MTGPTPLSDHPAPCPDGCEHPLTVHSADLGCWLCDCTHGRQAAALAGAEVRMVGEIRAILAAFDWEHDDRQLALEAIERIVLADEPEPEPEPEEYDPGPEVDDEGGMSEYRYTLPEDYQRGQS